MQDMSLCRADFDVLKTIKAWPSTQGMDDLFEVVLRHLLDLPHIHQAEIALYNKRNDLISVGAAQDLEFYGLKERKIRVQSWILESSVTHSSRRVYMPKFFSAQAFPLATPEKALGLLTIEFDHLLAVDHNVSDDIYPICEQLSVKINEIMLQNHIRELTGELQDHIDIVKESQQRITALSKELYAICAISTRINQSMDIQKSLRKSIEKIKEVFRASEVLVYFKESGDSLSRCATIDLKGKKCAPETLQQIEKTIRRDFLLTQQALKTSGRIPPYCPKRIDLENSPFGSLLFVPMMSKTRLIGVLVILNASHSKSNRENVRLLAGIANIMGIAIENMYLYRQSQQEKKTAAFLVQCISKFNEKLNLEKTLTSIAVKGAEFIGEKCRVFLLSETKTPMLQLDHQDHLSTDPGPRSSTFSRIQPEALKDFYDKMVLKKRPSLIADIRRSKAVRKAGRVFFQENDIRSILSIPLKFMDKPQGILLLCRGPGKRNFDHLDKSVAQAIGAAASAAMENARSYSASAEMSDFLEKKISEKTDLIRQIQERQRVRIENRTDIIFRVNSDHRFVFVNKAMERLSGYSREELYQQDIKVGDVVAREDRDRVRRRFGKILNGNRPIISDLEYRHINRKGDDHLVSLTMYPETDESGRVIGVEGVGRDITEKRWLEAELKKTKDLALLGEFSSAIAHQIRNPLGNILIGAKLLRRAVGLDGDGSDGQASDKETLSEIFNNLSEGIYNLNQVVTELVAYTRTLKLSRSLQCIDIIVQETLALFSDMIQQKNIRVERHVDPDLPMVSMDAVLISQVVQNIMHNAIQAMPTGGRLIMAAEPVRDKPEHVMISIGDTGPGIEEGLAKKIFNPFFTTKHSGAGLGLSLAHRIIEAHKGQIWVCHNPCRHLSDDIRWKTHGFGPFPRKGATFHVLLPTGEHSARPAYYSFPDSFLRISCG